MTEKASVCFVMTVPFALRAFMVDHIRELAKRYDVTVCCNFSKDSCCDLFESSVRLIHLPFERKISLWRDMQCLVLLFRTLRHGRFCSVHSIIPKTGLLAMTAGWLARIPVRIHTFTGQVWANRSGFSRILLKSMDRLTAFFATHIYADSPSQCDFLMEERVIRFGRVFGDGSISGVNTDRFKPDQETRKVIRSRFNIPDDQIIFGFLGRLNRDKGILDLIEAFSLSGIKERACLLLVGPDEEDIEQLVRERFSNVWKQIHFAGYTSEPEMFDAAFDVFCIPSYREGFGSSVIEAAACGIPALASRIYGLTDAVEENVTGLMHEPGNIYQIKECMEWLANHSELREKMGHMARERAFEKFSRNRLVSEMLSVYEQLLDGK